MAGKKKMSLAERMAAHEKEKAKAAAQATLSEITGKPIIYAYMNSEFIKAAIPIGEAEVIGNVLKLHFTGDNKATSETLQSLVENGRSLVFSTTDITE